LIGSLLGTVFDRDPAAGRVILDVGGVGYELAISMQTLRHVPDPGESCRLWVHTHAREDVLGLFGFGAREERTLFRMLISVPKVGPRNAMATLGGLPWPDLVRCIAAGEHARLTKIPGIGKKTAEQIVLTLGDKVSSLLEAAGGQARPPSDSESDHPKRDDAAAILVGLGWRAKAVDKALASVLAETESDASLDEIVRRTLARLMER
jgi:Holliday junction DNA helicase RuvA